ncbi:MAG: ABC transporter substrate-binding protein [Beijerinckiaceae bacterium]
MKKTISTITAALAFAGIATSAQALTELKMYTFGSATNLPIWIAQDLGLFEKNGLKVVRETTKGSKMQMKALMDGKYQIVSTAFDNIVAYTEGTGAAKYDNYDVVAIGGVHSGMNSVVTSPEVKKWSDLKGKTASVDALTSGYATVLYKILKGKGLERDKDYKVITVGSTGARVKSLKEKTSQIAIISSPADLRLKREGFHILADASQELGAYQGSVYATRKSWAKGHRKELVAFMKAIMEAQEMIHTNKAKAMEVLKAHVKGMTNEDMAEMFKDMTAPGGFSRKAALNKKGMQTVLDLRSIYGGQKFPAGYAKYIDTSYADAAMKK